jgi:membrane-bound inhibitor of C-type lysozyme
MPSRLAVALLTAAAASVAGCGGRHDAPSPADPPANAALPEGVSLYYSWDCDGGLHLVMKNLIQDRAISLETHEGSRKLPQAVSASGARYTDGTITFWTKGNTATYQREGGALLNCRLASSGNAHP